MLPQIDHIYENKLRGVKLDKKNLYFESVMTRVRNSLDGYDSSLNWQKK